MSGPLDVQSLVPQSHSKPVGKYSPGVRVTVSDTCSMVFISGQVAIDADGHLIGGSDAAAQTEAVFESLRSVLRECGADLDALVSVTIFLTDIRSLATVSAVRNRYLGDPPPASTLVEVSALAEPGVLVEINGIALIGG